MIDDDTTWHARKEQKKRDQKRKAKKEKKPRIPKRVTESSLEFDAMAYLARFVASEKHLATVLMRKVKRSATHHQQDPESFVPLIDLTVQKMVKAGMVDDAALAKGLVQSLHFKGKSRRFTQERLRQKGIPNDEAQYAMASFAEAEEHSELKAAIHCVKKKRLGPMREASLRKERYQRDLAALARAGFSYGIARKVLEPDDENSLFELIAFADF